MARRRWISWLACVLAIIFVRSSQAEEAMNCAPTAEGVRWVLENPDRLNRCQAADPDGGLALALEVLKCVSNDPECLTKTASAPQSEDPAIQSSGNDPEENVYQQQQNNTSGQADSQASESTSPDVGSAAEQPSLREQLKAMKAEQDSQSIHGAIAVGVLTVDDSGPMMDFPFWTAIILHASSPQQADDQAIEDCESNGGANCFVAYRWSGMGECGWVARGFARDLSQQSMIKSGYGVGASEAEAVAQCNQYMYGVANTCDQHVESYCN